MILWLACLSIISASAQKKSKETFYAFDKEWNQLLSLDNAAYFARMKRLNDTLWQWDVYNNKGPMIASQQMNNPETKTLSGWQMYYDSKGLLDSMGAISNGRMDGEWSYLDDSVNFVTTKIFSTGILLSVKDLRNKDNVDQKPTYSDEKESTFPGGLAKWHGYINKNMKYPDRAYREKITGTVVVAFKVDSAGSVQNTELFRSVEYSIDQETLRLMKASPKWNPGFQNGKYISTFKKQPLDFRLQ
ncbi:MAG TPA: energy transducer TonB [Flavitalea sp.]|nr:energy transducer TonB [Flavitalea sp.]